mgnify:FL=1
MPRQGLGKEKVVQAAVELIEENGLARFSMAELAKKLDIKTASLYNHVESLDDLLEGVGLYAVKKLVAVEEKALEGKSGDEAVFALAEAYRAFAREHFKLYRVIMGLPRSDNKLLEKGGEEIVRPISRVLSKYGLTGEQAVHWHRMLRAVMYGFAAHEESGGFSHYPVDSDKSYHEAIQCIVDGVHRAGEGRK